MTIGLLPQVPLARHAGGQCGGHGRAARAHLARSAAERAIAGRIRYLELARTRASCATSQRQC